MVSGGHEVEGHSSTSSEPTKSSEILDLDTEQWSTGGDMTEARSHHQLVTVNSRVVALGGVNVKSNPRWNRAEKVVDTAEELDMEQLTWRKLDVTMKRPRWRFSAAVMERSSLCI